MIPDRLVYESEYMKSFSGQMQQQISIAFNGGWLNGVMNAGYQIHDIGRDRSRRGPMSPWYAAERQEIARRKYPTISVNMK